MVRPTPDTETNPEEAPARRESILEADPEADIREAYHAVLQAHNDLCERLQEAYDKAYETENRLDRAQDKIDTFRTQTKTKDTLIEELTTTVRALRHNEQRQDDDASEPQAEGGNCDNKRRSAALPDPFVYEGKKEQDVDDWIARMKDKLETNADHYPTDRKQLAYLKTRLGGKASRQLQPRFREDARQPITWPEGVYEYLTKAFGDLNRKHTARAKFRTLIQGSKPFAEFWGEFQYLAAELDHSDDTLIEELESKLTPSLQRQMINGDEEPTDLYDFARRCQRADEKLRRVNATFPQGPRRSQTTSLTITMNTFVANRKPGLRLESGKLAKRARPNRDARTRTRSPTFSAEKEKMLTEGLCFRCHQPGHLAKDCPQQVPRVNVVDEDEKDDSESSSSEN